MIACLYDVHGNLAALEAVLADARAHAPAAWHLGGDYALFGPQPVECVERLRDLPGATWIRGNADRWTARPAESPGDHFGPTLAALRRHGDAAWVRRSRRRLETARLEGS